MRGFWSKGKLGITKLLAVVYTISAGMSRSGLVDMFGLKLSKNTWTKYVKDVGMVCSEALERNRRDPTKKYSNAQWDETAFGKRKYNRGSRRRKEGAQWGETCVEVGP